MKPTLVKNTTPKGGVIKEINDKLAAKAEEKKGNGAAMPEELSEMELSMQEGRKPVLVQGELPGQETPKLKDVIRAAESYRQARDDRMKMLKTEIERKALLMGIMKKHQLLSYHYENLVVEITNTENIKVKVDSDEDEE